MSSVFSSDISTNNNNNFVIRHDLPKCGMSAPTKQPHEISQPTTLVNNNVTFKSKQQLNGNCCEVPSHILINNITTTTAATISTSTINPIKVTISNSNQIASTINTRNSTHLNNHQNTSKKMTISLNNPSPCIINSEMDDDNVSTMDCTKRTLKEVYSMTGNKAKSGASCGGKKRTVNCVVNNKIIDEVTPTAATTTTDYTSTDADSGLNGRNSDPYAFSEDMTLKKCKKDNSTHCCLSEEVGTSLDARQLGLLNSGSSLNIRAWVQLETSGSLVISFYHKNRIFSGTMMDMSEVRFSGVRPLFHNTLIDVSGGGSGSGAGGGGYARGRKRRQYYNQTKNMNKRLRKYDCIDAAKVVAASQILQSETFVVVDNEKANDVSKNNNNNIEIVFDDGTKNEDAAAFEHKCSLKDCQKRFMSYYALHAHQNMDHYVINKAGKVVQNVKVVCSGVGGGEAKLLHNNKLRRKMDQQQESRECQTGCELMEHSLWELLQKVEKRECCVQTVVPNSVSMDTSSTQTSPLVNNNGHTILPPPPTPPSIAAKTPIEVVVTTSSMPPALPIVVNQHHHHNNNNDANPHLLLNFPKMKSFQSKLSSATTSVENSQSSNVNSPSLTAALIGGLSSRTVNNTKFPSTSINSSSSSNIINNGPSRIGGSALNIPGTLSSSNKQNFTSLLPSSSSTASIMVQPPPSCSIYEEITPVKSHENSNLPFSNNKHNAAPTYRLIAPLPPSSNNVIMTKVPTSTTNNVFISASNNTNNEKSFHNRSSRQPPLSPYFSDISDDGVTTTTHHNNNIMIEEINSNDDDFDDYDDQAPILEKEETLTSLVGLSEDSSGCYNAIAPPELMPAIIKVSPEKRFSPPPPSSSSSQTTVIMQHQPRSQRHHYRQYVTPAGIQLLPNVPSDGDDDDDVGGAISTVVDLHGFWPPPPTTTNIEACAPTLSSKAGTPFIPGVLQASGRNYNSSNSMVNQRAGGVGSSSRSMDIGSNNYSGGTSSSSSTSNKRSHKVHKS